MIVVGRKKLKDLNQISVYCVSKGAEVSVSF